MHVHAEFRVRPAEDDIRRVATYINADDAAEIRASTGKTPLEALMTSREVSALHGYYEQGQCKALFGIADYGCGVGVPWLVSTHDVLLKRNYWRAGKWFVRMWLKKFDVLTNLVSERHHRSRTYLTRLGFTFPGDSMIGADGCTRLLRFEQRRNNKCVNPQV